MKTYSTIFKSIRDVIIINRFEYFDIVKLASIFSGLEKEIYRSYRPLRESKMCRRVGELC